MKVALCFIINYEHILKKEEIWKKWIEPNQDIINVYFYYKSIHLIKSNWIKEHALPENVILPTSYFHIVPAYIILMNHAYLDDDENQWFCFLTDSCCPIISPKRFRYLFYKFREKSIMNWRSSYWNIDYHKRANLRLLPEHLRLANDPWFVLSRENVEDCFQFVKNESKLAHLICSGGLANESIFAIILKFYGKLDKVIQYNTHAADWTRMSNATSPHNLKYGNEDDIRFIEKSLNSNNKYLIFIRKIDKDFPDGILNHFIYNYNKDEDDKLYIIDPFLTYYLLQTLAIFVISSAVLRIIFFAYSHIMI